MMPASSRIKVLDPRQSYTKTFFQEKKKKKEIQTPGNWGRDPRTR